MAELTAKERAAAKGFSVIEGGRRGFIVDGINWGGMLAMCSAGGGRCIRSLWQNSLNSWNCPWSGWKPSKEGEITQRNFCIRYRETLEAAREARR